MIPLKRAFVLGVVLAFAIPGVARADATIVDVIAFETHTATTCAGTALLGSYQNCNSEAVLPITGGTASAWATAGEDGSFAFADAVSGGSQVENRHSVSFTNVGTSTTLTALARTVSAAVTYVVQGGTVSQSGLAGVLDHGFAVAYTYSGRVHDPLDQDPECDDGTAIQPQGQYLGSNFDQTTPPGTYVLRVSFTCSPAAIRTGQIFVVSVSTNGDVRSTHDDDAASASLSGKLERVQWRFDA